MASWSLTQREAEAFQAQLLALLQVYGISTKGVHDISAEWSGDEQVTVTWSGIQYIPIKEFQAFLDGLTEGESNGRADQD